MESMVIKQYKQRFRELEEELMPHFGGSAAAAFRKERDLDSLAANMFLNWTTKARSLIANSCGKDSVHYETFLEALQAPREDRQVMVLSRLLPIFLAIKEDYEKGYATPIITMARAEVFDDALDQAEELFSHKYFPPAAVIAGTVLEAFLRGQCNSKGIAPNKLTRMNADLTKAGAHDLTTQKKIEFFADVRNNAAHGKEVKEQDVKQMIEGIRQHVRQHSG